MAGESGILDSDVFHGFSELFGREEKGDFLDSNVIHGLC